MYQSIDDDIEAEEERTARWMPWALGAAGVAAVFALVALTRPGGPSLPGGPLQPEPEARAAYLRAIGETDPSLRRARLTDFLNQNPQDPRAPAAQAQLYVLDAAEARAWEDTVSAAYDPTLPIEAQRAAVKRFQHSWGRYLGGREAESAALLAQIEGTETEPDRPDRSLPDTPSPFPNTVPADQLAGGPVIRPAPPPIIFRPEPAPEPARPERVAEVVPPRVRRDSTPRYPRNAQRRGISGVVTLALNIDERGRVAMAEVVDVQAERYADDFVRAAERAAMRTRFHPKTVDGEPVAAMGVRKRYRFEGRR